MFPRLAFRLRNEIPLRPRQAGRLPLQFVKCPSEPDWNPVFLSLPCPTISPLSVRCDNGLTTMRCPMSFVPNTDIHVVRCRSPLFWRQPEERCLLFVLH